MKIAFVLINANRHEGTSRAVLEVAKRLVARGHQVDLLARTAEAIEGTGIRLVHIGGPSRPEVLDFASFRWLVDRRLRDGGGYDIIQSAGPNTSHADVYTIQTVHRSKMRQIAESRAVMAAGRVRRLSWWAYDQEVLRAERAAYRAVGTRGQRCFLPVSDGTRGELLDEFPGLRGPGGRERDCDGEPAASARRRMGTMGTMVRVIPNGADLDRFSLANRSSHRSEIRREHTLADDDFVLVFSGGDWRRKGLDLAIEAMSHLTDQRIKLLVVGHDRAGADVRRMADDSPAAERIIFAGFRKDVHRYYAAGDVFLFPTAYEAFSLATIEAAASGLPVLMPDVSGAAELIGDGSAGTMIPRAPQGICDAVMTYFNSPRQLMATGAAARNLVEQRFNWDAITEQTLAAYQELLQTRGQQN